ncbi:hypothetical protein FRUB_09146 [Fimbriiglobus ruber]|uniref:Uncharacterized protein n=1 Tax=Fimbriiglobus ruber TaxID=1908690 RepID=A0A225D6H2_9BACT|nr:hypothetical protein FRUB_09146 [Fimbriiglobus ruber]
MSGRDDTAAADPVKQFRPAAAAICGKTSQVSGEDGTTCWGGSTARTARPGEDGEGCQSAGCGQVPRA